MRGQSGGAIDEVELNNFLFASCCQVSASDNKCVRNPIRIQILIGKSIQYMLGATGSSKPKGDDDMHLSKNIKFLRTQTGIKQRELAEKLGVTSTAVGMWEAGAREPELSKIINLSEYFGVTLDDLVLKEMKPPIPVYALNIAYLRREHNMTQQEIAELLGVSKTVSHKYEVGEIEPPVDKLAKIADFFGVTMDQIVKQDLSREVRG